MATTNQLVNPIGKIGWWRIRHDTWDFKPAYVAVRVTDTKKGFFGGLKYWVEPVVGDGGLWIDARDFLNERKGAIKETVEKLAVVL